MNRRLLHRSLLTLTLVSLLVAPTSAGDVAATTRTLGTYVSAHAANGDFSGVVLVSRHGRRVFETSVGMASLAFGVRNGLTTRFLVASVTKTFTAAGIALLQDEGKLKIADSLEVYLPDFPPASKIKLLHLLGHQSGLANPDYEAIAARKVSPDELIAMIGIKPLMFEPGSNSRYSNAGYITLARVIEKVSGRRFGDFLKTRIFDRLGMKDSGTVGSGDVVPRLAEGYLPGVGKTLIRPQPQDPSSLYGSGNVFSTAQDLDRWLAAVDRHELFDIDKQPYPFGWGRRTWFDRRVLVQSGIVNGYCSVILTVPAEQLHVVVLMNSQSGFTGDEGKTLLGLALGQPAPLPERRSSAAVVVARSLLEQHAGLYLWGKDEIPMHIDTDGEVLTLRWADSSSVVPLTPLSKNRFLDRSSFGIIRFDDRGLSWTQNGEETPARRERSAAPAPKGKVGRSALPTEF